MRATHALRAAALWTLLHFTPAIGVQLAIDGDGDVLIYPLVTNEGQYDALVSVGLRDGVAGAALRLTLREATFGERVQSMNVLLAPGDSFAFALTNGVLVWIDDSCLDVGDAPVEQFFGFDAIAFPTPFRGYIEAFEMAALDPAEPWVRDLSQPDKDCAVAFETLAANAAAEQLVRPRGALVGNLNLIDVVQGISLPAPPTALEQFRDRALFAPVSMDSPTLADARPAQSVVFGDFPTAGAPRPALVSTWDDPIDAVSAALSVQQLETEFAIDPDLNARTDLVLTAPTRRFYVGTDGLSEREPFVAFLRNPFLDGPGQQLGLDAVDREGRGPRGFGRSPKCTPSFSADPGPLLNRAQLSLHTAPDPIVPSEQSEAAVIEYLGSSGCLTRTPLHVVFEAGRTRIDLDPYALRSREGHVHRGLPVVATTFATVQNGELIRSDGESLLSNYGLSYATARTVGVDYPQSNPPPAPVQLATVDTPSSLNDLVLAEGGDTLILGTLTRLTADDQDRTSDVFAVTTGNNLELLSTDLPGPKLESHRLPAVSADGLRVAWQTCRVDPGGGLCEYSIRVFDRQSGTLSILQELTGIGSAGPDRPVLSDDGMLVAWRPRSGDVAVYDFRTNETLEFFAGEDYLIDFSGDGRSLIVARGGNEIELLAIDLVSGAETVLLPDTGLPLSRLLSSQVSADLRRALLVDRDRLYLANLMTGAVVPLRHPETGLTFHSVEDPKLSRDGSQLVFLADQSLLPGVPRSFQEVYRLVLDENRLSLVSVDSDGYAARGEQTELAVSRDGSVVAYLSAASNLAQFEEGGAGIVVSASGGIGGMRTLPK